MHRAPVSLGPTREVEGSRGGVRPAFLEGVWLEATLWDGQNEVRSGEDVALGVLHALVLRGGCAVASVWSQVIGNHCADLQPLSTNITNNNINTNITPFQRLWRTIPPQY